MEQQNVRREAVPLHKNRQRKLINTANEYPDSHKRVTVLLGLGTGARASTVGHIHADWFFYEGDNLYLQIKNEAECRKNSRNDACADCRQAGRDYFEAKTDAGKERIILITDNYTDYSAGDRNGEEKWFGLRHEVESYFALDTPDAPDDPTVRRGWDMIQARGKDGVSKSTATDWLREIAAESSIKAPMRKRRLKKSLRNDGDGDNTIEEQISDWGTDEQGNSIPDLTFHDLRACYCTQLMRSEVPPNRAVKKTGHENPDSLRPYVMFAANEIDADEEDNWF